MYTQDQLMSLRASCRERYWDHYCSWCTPTTCRRTSLQLHSYFLTIPWSSWSYSLKCEVLRVTKKKNHLTHQYRMHGTELQTVNQAKISLHSHQQNLSWIKHVDSVAKKATTSLKFLKRYLHECPNRVKVKCYKDKGHNMRFLLQQSTMNTHIYLFYINTVRIWNKLPQEVVSASRLRMFKQKLPLITSMQRDPLFLFVFYLHLNCLVYKH